MEDERGRAIPQIRQWQRGEKAEDPTRCKMMRAPPAKASPRLCATWRRSELWLLRRAATIHPRHENTTTSSRIWPA